MGAGARSLTAQPHPCGDPVHTIAQVFQDAAEQQVVLVATAASWTTQFPQNLRGAESDRDVGDEVEVVGRDGAHVRSVEGTQPLHGITGAWVAQADPPCVHTQVHLLATPG